MDPSLDPTHEPPPRRHDDLKSDPSEARNLYGDPRYQDLVAKLRSDLGKLVQQSISL